MWASHVDGRGGLFYGYEPSERINGQPISAFPRVTLQPSLQLPSVNLQRVVRQGLDIDAKALVAEFRLTSADLEQASGMHVSAAPPSHHDIPSLLFPPA